MFDRDALPRVLPFLVYMFFVFLDDMLGRLGWQAHELRHLYAVKIGAVLALLLAYRRRYTELATWTLGAGGVLAAALAGVVVLVLWINLNAGWMSVGAAAGFDPRTDGAIDWLMVAVRIAGAALVVPVMEELFWRSFLMRWIDTPDFLAASPARVKARGFVVAVILFGFEHNLWLAGIVAGAVYSILYMRSQSLWSPIVAHGVTNGLLGGWIVSTGHWTYW
ncbi:CAAX prenyl protease-related protein [Janthinobacterium fluminis]|uniref:CAAX prenyl protease-related protein n=1 Tax=Janthinobacterium fluminis TaxID=2987524 RepID=A0ABT5JXY5_9BURK|nr:CAAX prenyl protease-related protein [Janthinobacterium fluminis]MDC8757598.1 CAAX prenyl protease-related protein [Janthinobacterium fluminis]